MQNNNTEKSKFALDHVLSQFPNHMETIKEFYEHSPTFREICDDHAEMATWIEKYCQSEKQLTGNCEYALEVLKDLETEIIECLERKNKIVNNESMRS